MWPTILRPRSSASYAGEMAGAVPEARGRHAGLVQDVQVEVVERGLLRKAHVPPALDRARPAAGYKNRKIVMRVAVCIGSAAAVNDDGVVKQVALAVRRRLQPIQ